MRLGRRVKIGHWDGRRGRRGEAGPQPRHSSLLPNSRPAELAGILRSAMTPSVLFLLVALLGLLLAAGGTLVIRAAGARPGLARRLAGPPQVKVGSLDEPDAPRDRAVRVRGRIRCREPLNAAGGERLVAFHRDVEVRIGGRWRTIERMRETRSFEMWDHDGSLTVDPAQAAEPLVTIPSVWRGSASELGEPHASAVARLAERHGAPATEARSTTRTINVTDQLLVLARPHGDRHEVSLEPPEGGFLITNLALDDAMRLLGGSNRRGVAMAVVAVAVGVALASIGIVGAIGLTLLGG